MEWWEFPEQEAPLAPPSSLAPVPKASLAVSRQERIASIEEELHHEAATVLNDALHFMDVEPGPLGPDGEPTSPVVPQKWIDELGEEGARRRLRTATLALSSAKDAPVGLKMAKDALIGMAKVKAVKSAPKQLNMIVVNMAGPLPVYEELEVLK